MKAKVLTFTMMLAFILAGAVCKAEDAFAAKKTFAGTVNAIITQDIAYGFNDGHRGIIDYVAKPGSLFFGPLCDAKGNVVHEGTLLLHINTAFRESQLAAAKATLQQDIAAMEIAKINYEMNDKLSRTHSVAENVALNSKAAYLESIATIEQAKSNLKMAQEMLDICTLRASFDGIVNMIYFPFGLAAGELKVLNVSLMNPIGISIKMDRTVAQQINKNTPITVYPVNSTEPHGVYHGSGILTSDGISFSAENYIIYPPVKLEKDGKKIPLINMISTVTEYKPKGFANLPDNPTLVTAGCIMSDDQGEYVWRLKGAKNNVPGKGLDYLYTVEKIYLKPMEEKESLPYYQCILLGKDSEIKPGDVLIPEDSLREELHDGDTVCLSTGKYVFMPGDPVTVEIGPNPTDLK